MARLKMTRKPSSTSKTVRKPSSKSNISKKTRAKQLASAAMSTLKTVRKPSSKSNISKKTRAKQIAAAAIIAASAAGVSTPVLIRKLKQYKNDETPNNKGYSTAPATAPATAKGEYTLILQPNSHTRGQRIKLPFTPDESSVYIHFVSKREISLTSHHQQSGGTIKADQENRHEFTARVPDWLQVEDYIKIGASKSILYVYRAK